MKTRLLVVCFSAVSGWVLSADVIHASDMILNEYNAVGNGLILEGDGEDPFWRRTMENGGDWFELVVITDHLDIRGWQFSLQDDVGDDVVLALTQHEAWSDLRSGTILTVSEDLSNNVSDYNPAVGQWWINVRANDETGGTFITPSNFRTNNNNWQLRILDSAGRVVFGPAGEGVNPLSGVSDVEVFKLEEDPSGAITPESTYADGQSSSFGAPNVWNDGVNMQDFSSLRSVVPYFPLSSVRINEVLTHTDAPEEDWIELYNMTDQPIDIGGWYLSDDEHVLTMFAIPAGTIIPSRGFVTIGEGELNFALAASRGDEVFLSEADATGMMIGGRDHISFGPAHNGMSFGRSPDGTGRLYPMVVPTKQAINARDEAWYAVNQAWNVAGNASTVAFQA